ncbi:large ribosomal subunit protein mL37-like [Nerophis lumbriciformis]|uniref:large ribosomal subunit protein mL37-like n=1 Tax=Nerophis lumbriciformis TaxID=546530 RepID=UPI003BAD20D6
MTAWTFFKVPVSFSAFVPQASSSQSEMSELVEDLVSPSSLNADTQEDCSNPPGGEDYLFVEARHPNTVLQGLNTLRLFNSFCDVTLCCGGQEFPCHRIVLASFSSYFQVHHVHHRPEGVQAGACGHQWSGATDDRHAGEVRLYVSGLHFQSKCPGDDLFQIRGQNGLVYNSMDPLTRVSGTQDVSATADHTLETFYPVSPTVDLQKVHVYKEDVNCTGFGDKYFFPHAHTLYFLEDEDVRCKLRPEQFRAKMIMFLFGSALARAHKLFGAKTMCVLDHPITVQAVGTNGRIFQFMVFQLNTTDLRQDDGIKNQVWLDEDVELYDFAKVRPLIKKKEVKVPAGLAGYKAETFSKFLALYLHGTV